MKEAAGVFVVAAVLIGVSALAVGPMGDREVFTPPPDAVGEGFLRSVVSSRYDQAREYLVEPDAVSNDVLSEMEHRIESRIGDVHDVKGEVVSRTDEGALVNVQLKSAGGSDAMGVSLRWEGSEWKVVPPGASDTIAADARRWKKRPA